MTTWSKTKILPRVTQSKLAAQVASLVNAHNKLRYSLSMGRVLHGQTAYLVEMDGETVAGCVGIKKQRRKSWWEICNLCVHPEYRGQKLAPKLVEAAYKHIPTGNAWATIREDNIPSIKTFLRCGFKILSKYKSPNRKYYLVIMTREREKRSGRDETTVHHSNYRTKGEGLG
jgi:ribosomal protein S18 acetylase RimI-like enzyme